MAKKLVEIESLIKSREKEFINYLEHELNSDVFRFVNEITHITNTYLFSGIIRNFFLGYNEIRDVDIVVESDKNIQRLIERYPHKKNSFGGHKIKIGNTKIDLWGTQNTWAFNSYQTLLDFGLEKYLPYTAFFNFSAVLYSINEERFLYTKPFLNFLRDKEIDVVFTPNANYQLCLINSFYYSDKYHLDISEKLKDLIKKIYYRENTDYKEVQYKHFGKVLYENKEIERRIIALSI